MNDLYLYDKAIKEDFPLLCGVDEAGRGPLCGPVCCAAVVLKDDFCCDEINDSKKISEKKREKLFDVIIENCVSYSIVFVEPQVIDEINILNATKKAMTEAVMKLKVKPEHLLIDAEKLNLDIPYTPIIKGDAFSISIAAASIIAKVTRDRMMQEYDAIYPGYNFTKNKGE
jgi:ribonuclease HII